jgi:hypothetical protein
MGGGASKHKLELRKVQAAHVLTNTLRHNNRLRQRARETAELAAEKEELRALRDEVAILRHRCGDATHGDVQRDVDEREAVIRDLEALLKGPATGPTRGVAAMVCKKLKGELREIRERVPAVAAR